VQSEVRFNRVPEKVQKVPEKVSGGFGAEPRSSSTGIRRRFGKFWRMSVVLFN
jgi:hypothetical protein